MILTTDKTVDLLIELHPDFEKLVEKMKNDTEWQEAIRNAKNNKNNAEFINKVYPVLLKNYRDDIYYFLSRIYETDIDSIKNQSVFITLKQLKELGDEGLFDFFK